MAGRRQLREGGHCWDEAPGMAASQQGTHGERRHHGIVRGPPAAEGICVCHNHRNFQSLSTQKHWRVSPSDGPHFRRKSIVYDNICSPGRRLGNYLFLVYDFQHMLQAAARQKRDGRARLSRACPPPRQHRYFRRPRTVPSPPPPTRSASCSALPTVRSTPSPAWPRYYLPPPSWAVRRYLWPVCGVWRSRRGLVARAALRRRPPTAEAPRPRRGRPPSGPFLRSPLPRSASASSVAAGLAADGGGVLLGSPPPPRLSVWGPRGPTRPRGSPSIWHLAGAGAPALPVDAAASAAAVAAVAPVAPVAPVVPVAEVAAATVAAAAAFAVDAAAVTGGPVASLGLSHPCDCPRAVVRLWRWGGGQAKPLATSGPSVRLSPHPPPRRSQPLPPASLKGPQECAHLVLALAGRAVAPAVVLSLSAPVYLPPWAKARHGKKRRTLRSRTRGSLCRPRRPPPPWRMRFGWRWRRCLWPAHPAQGRTVIRRPWAPGTTARRPR